MFNLGLLGFSAVVGTPVGLYARDKLEGVYNAYTERNRLRNEFKSILKGLDISLEIHSIYENEKSIYGELKGVYKVYKLNMVKNEFITRLSAKDGHFTQMDEYIYFKFNKASNIKEFEEYKYTPLPPTTLLLGYGDTGLITADMKKTPHLICVGTSNSGKSYCIETALRNLRGAAITLLNAFEEDFKGIKTNRVNDIGDIQKYLMEQVVNKEKRNKATYIVIDEYNVLSVTKGIDKLLMELLAQARHYNVYVILIAQRGNSDDIKYKGLFNTRVCFRTVEEATRKAILGVTTERVPPPREFYLSSDSLYYGKTFTLK